jgi:predicted nucleotidyltransferase
VRNIPRPVYELADLLGKHIEGQFYAEELSPVIVTKNTVYHIDKLLRRRFRNGRSEVFVKWRNAQTNLILEFLLKL